MSTGACRTCEAPIRWVFTAKGHRMPLDPTPVDGGNVELHQDREGGQWIATVVTPEDGVERHRSHFASCKDADAHRRSR